MMLQSSSATYKVGREKNLLKKYGNKLKGNSGHMMLQPSSATYKVSKEKKLKIYGKKLKGNCSD